MDITGYVLAGGKSRRFGSDKARALLSGVPLIVKVSDSLHHNCDEVIAVADVAGKYHDLGVGTIADLRPGLGPVAGLETALTHRVTCRGAGWIVLVSCDFAGIRTEWTEFILNEVRGALVGLTTNAVAFREGFWQPFPGAFHTRLLPVVSDLLSNGHASFQRLLDQEGKSAVALPLPSDWPPVPQVNTPEDLAALQAECTKRRQAP